MLLDNIYTYFIKYLQSITQFRSKILINNLLLDKNETSNKQICIIDSSPLNFVGWGIVLSGTSGQFHFIDSVSSVKCIQKVELGHNVGRWPTFRLAQPLPQHCTLLCSNLFLLNWLIGKIKMQ